MSVALRPASFADLLALGEDVKADLIGGVVEIQALPRFRHGRTQAGIGASLTGPYDWGIGGPGGWWIVTDTAVRFASDTVLRPDIVGWRKERLPSPPSEYPVEARPDWVCEVLSPANRRTDLVTKRGIYERAAVPWYWQVDPELRSVTVLEWSERGYIVRMVAMDEDVEPIPPFLDVPLAVKNWFPPHENEVPSAG